MFRYLEVIRMHSIFRLGIARTKVVLNTAKELRKLAGQAPIHFCALESRQSYQWLRWMLKMKECWEWR